MAAINDPQIWTMIAAFIGLQVYALRHMDAKFDAIDERFDHQTELMNERFDHQTEVMDVRFSALEHRVAAVEDDLKLVKQHLIPPAA